MNESVGQRPRNNLFNVGVVAKIMYLDIVLKEVKSEDYTHFTTRCDS
jgi:hypothetical protein